MGAQAICCGQGFDVNKPRVLLVAADDNNRIGDVADLLSSTGSFSQVDTFNTLSGSGTPTVSLLNQYQAVLVWASPFASFAVVLGNNLATYWGQGGHVVVATAANGNVPLGGTWQSGGYNLLETGLPQASTAQTLDLVINEVSSPLVAGVRFLTATQAFRSNGAPINGGVVVATWGNGEPLIVRGERSTASGSRNLVSLNMYPPSSRVGGTFWLITTDGVAIMRNALLFA